MWFVGSGELDPRLGGIRKVRCGGAGGIVVDEGDSKRM